MSITDFLLDADPAIRWQVMRDLLDAPAEAIAHERARVAREGWGARLLDVQGVDGQWAGGACFPGGHDWNDPSPGQPWISTLPTLQLLHDLGVDPLEERVEHAIEGVRKTCRWEHAGQPFFDGEVEPCINGRVVMLGVYFGVDVAPIVQRLLDEQLPDGGWNCDAERGSVRSSFHTTINVLEGLLAFERAIGATPRLTEARQRGEAYLLDRKLLRRLSTGEIVKPAFLRFAFPNWWHYDVLRALDYFRVSLPAPDARLAEAIDLLRAKRQPDGTWLLDQVHPGAVHFTMESADTPSRWITLRATRILRWCGETII